MLSLIAEEQIASLLITVPVKDCKEKCIYVSKQFLPQEIYRIHVKDLKCFKEIIYISTFVKKKF